MLAEITHYVNEHWIIFLFVIVFGTLLLNFIARHFFRFLLSKAEETHNLWDDAVVIALKVPIQWAIWLFGLNMAAMFTARVNDLGWLPSLTLFNKTAAVVVIAWVLLRLISRIETNMTTVEYLSRPMDVTTATVIRKLLHASIVITAGLVILQSYGISVSGVLAFGGIGGIAIGFAAQDLLANFFGALMIYLDKPFSVGDWIRSPDRQIEGTVEDIGWRQTVIRTFDKRPLYVPNSVFTRIAVENPSRMSNRRIYETVGVRYDDVDKVASIVDSVRTMLRNHQEIDQKQTLIVNLNLFGPSSLDFFVYSFTKTTDWVKYHEIKQDVLLKIEDIVASAGAEIAFPTQTLHLSGELPNLGPQSPLEATISAQHKASDSQLEGSQMEGNQT